MDANISSLLMKAKKKIQVCNTMGTKRHKNHSYKRLPKNAAFSPNEEL